MGRRPHHTAPCRPRPNGTATSRYPGWDHRMVPEVGALAHLADLIRCRRAPAPSSAPRIIVPNRRLNVVARRGLAAATSGLILAGALMPAAMAAAGAPPVLRSDYINTLKNVTTTGNVLANDKDPSGGGLVFDSFTPVSVSVGTLTIASNGAYSFSPATNWTGTASTTYQAHNTNRSRTGNIYITVRTENAAPVANDDVLTLGEDSTTDVTADILANDTDVDGDTLWVTGVSGAVGGTVDLTTEIVTFTASADLCGSSAAGFDYTITDGFLTAATGHVTVDITCANPDPTDALTVTAVSNPSGGTVSLVAGTITFVPTANLCGSDAASFDYTVDDGNGGTDTGTVTIDLTCENDGPAAGDDTVSVAEDTATNVTGTLLDNDSDLDDDTLAASAVSNATGGSVVLVGDVVTFTPSANLCGTAAGTEDTNVTITASDLAADDTDPDTADALTVTAVSNPSGGTVSLVAGTITFVPTANLCGSDAASFDYTVDDGNGGTDTGTVTIDLTCENDGPAAGDDTVS